MIIENEWRSLVKNLTEAQQTDGRRCFYAGVLALLSELNRPIRPSEIEDMKNQIEKALSYGRSETTSKTEEK